MQLGMMMQAREPSTEEAKWPSQENHKVKASLGYTMRLYLKKKIQGWRDGSVVKSTDVLSSNPTTT